MKRMLCNYRLLLLMAAALAGSVPLSAQEAHPQPRVIFSISAGSYGGRTRNSGFGFQSDLLAERQQIAVAKGDVTQARLRQKPDADSWWTEEVNGGDNAINVKGSLPLSSLDAVHVGRKSRRTRKKPRSRAWRITSACSPEKFDALRSSSRCHTRSEVCRTTSPR